MRIAIGQFREITEETMTFGRQLGITSVQLNVPNIPGTTHWEYEDLLALRLECEKYGMKLEALENTPFDWYLKPMLGMDGRDEQIEYYKTTIRNMGKAGIPILGYHFMPNSVWRTPNEIGRAGSIVTAFDAELLKLYSPQGDAATAVADPEITVQRLMDEGPLRPISEDEMWDNYEYFIRAIIPVAEEAGVKLALHPDDPPVPEIGGISRLFYKFENFKRAMEMADSEAWGLDLCLGCCSEMPGGANSVKQMIEFFGPLGKILYVHFRDVQGTVPKFKECYLGEGNYNPAEIMLLLKRSGFTGFMSTDHVPHLVNDSPWQHRSRAHAIGYMEGLINMVNLLDSK
ncbi:mannonate dehydratase [Paenibacillus baekrokdamisoli]|uniref:mannonate dehydratase n=1 Tax=Paenibacillus baekrokdamisoli TaxID=1712516 RepID=A0A3G9ITE4_9BACL|nr:mannonate dehydratase [Paenibacillus baekrokdamisoli]MBB3070914.1 mannonate dehydratase [Paenibacillus baekrokdamisoli]BBH22147.1 mannonate dehydratase [Paenibacillus baekrokdamisoli]